MKYFSIVIIISGLSSLFAQAQKNIMDEKVPCRIIYKIDVNVRSKRPDKNISPPLWKYAVLVICRPEDEKYIPQRQTIGVVWNGKKSWEEIVSVEKVFENEPEALRYALQNHIPIAADDNNPDKIDYLKESDITVSNAIESDTTRQTFIGIARNAKSGACLVTEDGQSYYIEKLAEWENYFLNKKIAVSGDSISKEQNEPLVNDKGEYSGGSEGNITLIRNVVLPNVHDNFSLVIVFKKETSEKYCKKLLDETNYPYSEGMDSSKGKVYFYNTGKKYFVLFPTEKALLGFLKKYSEEVGVYEVYRPDFDIQKD